MEQPDRDIRWWKSYAHGLEIALKTVVPQFRLQGEWPEVQYDYTNQAWVIDGLYQRCGHPEDMDCQCYGRIHAGEEALSIH